MKGIYIIWLRELKKYWRNKSRIVGSLGMPFFLMFIVGSGLNESIKTPMLAGQGYTAFIMPGIIGMVLMFSSVFSGVSVIWDKQFGFMKEMLVAPISRTRIIIGKTLGGATTSISQALIMLLISFIIGVRLESFVGFLYAIPIMLLISCSFVAIGTAIASKMNDMHGFQLIVNFLIMPLFFLSGALFPIENLPAWLSFITKINPLTYGVEGLRYSFLGTSSIPYLNCIMILSVFFILSIAVGTYFFRKMEV